MVNTAALASCLGTPNYKLNLYIANKFDLDKISARAYIFQRLFLRDLFLDGLIYGRKIAFQNRLGLYSEGNLRLKTDWASL